MESIDPGSFCYGVFFCLCVVGVGGLLWYFSPRKDDKDVDGVRAAVKRKRSEAK